MESAFSIRSFKTLDAVKKDLGECVKIRHLILQIVLLRCFMLLFYRAELLIVARLRTPTAPYKNTFSLNAT